MFESERITPDLIEKRCSEARAEMKDRLWSSDPVEQQGNERLIQRSVDGLREDLEKEMREQINRRG